MPGGAPGGGGGAHPGGGGGGMFDMMGRREVDGDDGRGGGKVVYGEKSPRHRGACRARSEEKGLGIKLEGETKGRWKQDGEGGFDQSPSSRVEKSVDGAWRRNFVTPCRQSRQTLRSWHYHHPEKPSCGWGSRTSPRDPLARLARAILTPPTQDLSHRLNGHLDFTTQPPLPQ
jgi:hypothetical protein